MRSLPLKKAKSTTNKSKVYHYKIDFLEKKPCLLILLIIVQRKHKTLKVLFPFLDDKRLTKLQIINSRPKIALSYKIRKMYSNTEMMKSRRNFHLEELIERKMTQNLTNLTKDTQ